MAERLPRPRARRPSPFALRPADAGRDGPGLVRALSIVSALLAAAAAAEVFGSKLTDTSLLEALIVRGAGGLALLVLACETIEFARWSRPAKRDDKKLTALLLRRLRTAWLAFAPVAALGLILTPSLLQICSFALVYGWYARWRRQQGPRIRRRLQTVARIDFQNPKVPSVGWHVETLRTDTGDIYGRLVIWVPTPKGLVDFARRRERSPNHGMRPAILCAWLLLLGFACCGVAAATVGISVLEHHHHGRSGHRGHDGRPSHQHTAQPHEVAATSTREARLASVAPAAPAQTAIPPAPPGWNGLCPEPPGRGAPSWAAASINLLFEGDGQPGTAIAGCTRSFHLSGTGAGQFTWAPGEDPVTHATLSVVVARRHGHDDALFLAPATKPVLRLIARYPRIGGTRRVGVAGGDLYGVHTPVGTYLLTRASTGTPDDAKPYVELPPPVARAFMVAVRGSVTAGNGWLWPMAPRREQHELVYELGDGEDPESTKATIAYHPAKNTATFNGQEYRADPRHQIKTVELKEVAAENAARE